MRKPLAPACPAEILTTPQKGSRLKMWGSIRLAIAAALLLLELCACGGDPASISAYTPAAFTEAEEILPAEETPPGYNTVRDGYLTVVTCTDFPPYCYREDGSPAGIEPALAESLAEHLGLSLRIYEAGYSALEDEVTQGRADLALAGLVPGESEEGLIFTAAFYDNVQLILAPEGGTDALSEGLEGHTVGTLAGSQGELRLSWDLEDAGKAVLVRFDTQGDALAALGAGEIDCLVLDSAPAGALAALDYGGVEILPGFYLSESYAGLMCQDNVPLYEAVNDAIAAMLDGGQAQEIVARYLPAG